MPTIITHAVVAHVSATTFTKRPKSYRIWILSLVCSVFPDIDVIGFSFGVQYADLFGHRGFFHSISFALIFSIFLCLLFLRDCGLFSYRWWKYVLFLFLVGASHGILDAFTDGGLGIALLSPFDNARYFSPWTPIKVSPIGLRAFISDWGLRVMISEIIYIWLPLLIFSIAYRIAGHKLCIESKNNNQ